jgi:hypothetical protein
MQQEIFSTAQFFWSFLGIIALLMLIIELLGARDNVD